MVLFINILILNPDEMMHHHASRAGGAVLSRLTRAVVDHDTLTSTIAESIRRNVEKDMREKHGLDVSLTVKESHSLYCVIELRMHKVPSGMFSWLSVCCEAESAAIFVTEKAMAMQFPSSLKAELKNESIDADVVVVRDAIKQEQYEHKVLDLLYPTQPGDISGLMESGYVPLDDSMEEKGPGKVGDYGSPGGYGAAAYDFGHSTIVPQTTMTNGPGAMFVGGGWDKTIPYAAQGAGVEQYFH